MPVRRPDPEFRYPTQRIRRGEQYNWSLFRGLFLITLSLILISVNVRMELGSSLSSYLVLPLDYAYQWARDRALAGREALRLHWSTHQQLLAAQDENLRLREQLAQLYLETQEYRGMAAAWPLHFHFEEQGTVPAHVIRFVDDPLRRSLLLDRGRQHGLSKYMPAVVADNLGRPALVGRLVELRPYASLLLLIQDAHSAVAAEVGDATEVHGMVMGTGRGCVFKVSRDAVLSQGDPILTSGRGIYYPPGLLLGHVESDYGDPVGLELAYPLRTPYRPQELRQVLLLPNLYREDALALENEP